MKVIRVPIIACSECFEGYDAAEWRALQPIEPDADRRAKLEAHSPEMARLGDWRRCSVCDHALVLCGEPEDCVVPADAYRALFPHTRRREVDLTAFSLETRSLWRSFLRGMGIR